MFVESNWLVSFFSTEKSCKRDSCCCNFWVSGIVAGLETCMLSLWLKSETCLVSVLSSANSVFLFKGHFHISLADTLTSLTSCETVLSVSFFELCDKVNISEVSSGIDTTPEPISSYVPISSSFVPSDNKFMAIFSVSFSTCWSLGTTDEKSISSFSSTLSILLIWTKDGLLVCSWMNVWSV